MAHLTELMIERKKDPTFLVTEYEVYMLRISAQEQLAYICRFHSLECYKQYLKLREKREKIIRRQNNTRALRHAKR